MSKESAKMTIGLIVGSAYHAESPPGLQLTAKQVATPHGTVVLHHVIGRDAVVSFRHGLPHRFLPHHIPFRAHAAALAGAGVGALVVTSSVGVLDAALPLHQQLLVSDLIMLENRMPDGSTCTMFEAPTSDQGHLVLGEGLFSDALDAQVETIAAACGAPIARRVVFGYAQGPRTKTATENRAWRQLGADVSSCKRSARRRRPARTRSTHCMGRSGEATARHSRTVLNDG